MKSFFFSKYTLLHLVSAILLIKVAPMFLADYDFSLSPPRDSRGDVFGRDFMAFWSASKMAIMGLAKNAYIHERFSDFVSAEFSVKHGLRWAYPPSYLLFIYPLAKLPYLYSFVMYNIFSISAILYTLRKIGNLGLASILVVIMSIPLFASIVLGQNGILLCSLIYATFLIYAKSPIKAGFLTALVLLSKPHLSLPVILYFIVKKQRKALISTALFSFLIFIASVICFGIDIWQQYFEQTIWQHANAQIGE